PPPGVKYVYLHSSDTQSAVLAPGHASEQSAFEKQMTSGQSRSFFEGGRGVCRVEAQTACPPSAGMGAGAAENTGAETATDSRQTANRNCLLIHSSLSGGTSPEWTTASGPTIRPIC